MIYSFLRSAQTNCKLVYASTYYILVDILNSFKMECKENAICDTSKMHFSGMNSIL